MRSTLDLHATRSRVHFASLFAPNSIDRFTILNCWTPFIVVGRVELRVEEMNVRPNVECTQTKWANAADDVVVQWPTVRFHNKATPRIPHQARNYDILNRRRCYGVTTTMPTPLLLTSQAKMPQSRTKIRIGINTLLVVANRSPGLWAIREFISFPEMRSVRVLTSTTARHAGSFENRLFRVTFGASRRESLIAQRWSL